MSIIIHTYINKCKTIPLAPGLADFLRGTMYLYQESKTHPHMDLVVDFSQHPIHNFINPQPKNLEQKYQELIVNNTTLEIVECFHKDNYKLKNAVHNTFQPNYPPQRLICFEYYNEFDPYKGVPFHKSSLPRDTQEFMKQILDFTPELKEDADDLIYQLLPNIPIGLTISNTTLPFCILHIRMGDQIASQETPPTQSLSNLEAYITNHLLPEWGNTRIIVMSDSYSTKQYLSTKYHIPATNFMPVHLGSSNRFLHPNHNYGTYEADIGQTLIEFIIMSKASHIYMYSVYNWGSGFSYICSHIYDIPYTRICFA